MAYGVLFSFLASVCFNLSNLMEKRAVDSMVEFSARRSVHMFRLLLTSRLWLIGFVISLVALGFLIVAFSLTPIAVVQTIFGAGLVLLVLVSSIYFHEPIGRRELAGLSCIIAAVILVSLSLSSSTTPGTGGSVDSMLIASLVTAGVAVVVFVVFHRSTVEASVRYGVTSALFYGIGALATKSASVLVTKHGVLNALPRILASPYPYVFVVASLLGLVLFQMGLQRGRIGVVAPLSNVLASVYIVIVGMALYHEHLPIDPALSLLRFVGFGLVLVGSALLTATRSPAAGEPGVLGGLTAPSKRGS